LCAFDLLLLGAELGELGLKLRYFGANLCRSVLKHEHAQRQSEHGQPLIFGEPGFTLTG
jgi:hypothetical protein